MLSSLSSRHHNWKRNEPVWKYKTQAFSPLCIENSRWDSKYFSRMEHLSRRSLQDIYTSGTQRLSYFCKKSNYRPDNIPTRVFLQSLRLCHLNLAIISRSRRTSHNSKWKKEKQKWRYKICTFSRLLKAQEDLSGIQNSYKIKQKLCP